VPASDAELAAVDFVDLGLDAAAGWDGALDAADVPPLTVTSGVIFFTVAAAMPAFDRSATDEYGLPEMIFFAVAAPTPGSASSSFSLAVFKSTFAVDEAALLAEELDDFFSDWAACAVEAAAPQIKSATENQSTTLATVAFIESSLPSPGWMFYSDFPNSPLSPATTDLALSAIPATSSALPPLKNASRWLVTVSGSRPFKWVTTASTSCCALSCGSPVFCMTS
jgi:hypothetical protein